MDLKATAARHRTPALPPARSGRVSGQPWLRPWASADSVAAQQLRDLRAGRFRVVGRQGDVLGGGAGLDEGADGGGPVGGGVVDLGEAAADLGRDQRGAVPGGVACLDAGAAVEQQPDDFCAAGAGGGVQRVAPSWPRASSGKPASSMSRTAPAWPWPAASTSAAWPSPPG